MPPLFRRLPRDIAAMPSIIRAIDYYHAAIFRLRDCFISLFH
jgi:hypothetical protein